VSCPLVSYVAYAPVLQTTTDDNRRQRPLLVCSVGGPVITCASLLRETHMTYGIKQCYLPSGRGENPAFT